jgi:hypothetical protein
MVAFGIVNLTILMKLFLFRGGVYFSQKADAKFLKGGGAYEGLKECGGDF